MSESDKDQNLNPKELKRLLEAFLFVSDKPVTLTQLKEATGAETSDIRGALDSMAAESTAQERGFRLKALAGGYQWITDPSLSEEVKRFYRMREKRKLSQASMETLSIIAYRQPATRAEIELIRGVNVDGAIRTLLEKGLVRVAGRKDVAGRPLLYATTPQFLDHFGLSHVKDLPRLAEFTENDIELPDSMKATEEMHESTEHQKES